jgi:hypothetical protein
MSERVSFEQITVAASAVGLSAATLGGYVTDQGTPQRARFVLTVETAAVRYRTDGTPPTSSVGMLLNPGDVLTIDTPDEARALKLIRTTATSATVDVEAYVN